MFFFLLFLLSVLLIFILILASITIYINRGYNKLYENLTMTSVNKYKGKMQYNLDNKCKVINSQINFLGEHGNIHKILKRKKRFLFTN